MGVFVRDGYLESKRIAKLANNPSAEVFYFHLLLAVDQNGEIDYDRILLKNRCFPALDSVSLEDIDGWVNACGEAGLIELASFLDGTSKLIVLRHGNPAKSKPIPDESISCFPFEEFWEMYGKKVDRKKCEVRYSYIKEKERSEISKKLPEYIKATPNLAYRKNPLTWLNGACWNDKISDKTDVALERKKGF